MGKIKQGILGAVSGKVGSVVGASWKGIATLRSMPASVANPRTAGQVSARTRFRALVLFASAILAEIVKPLWDRFAQQKSGYNAFISRNYDAANGIGEIDPTKIITSQGKMGGTAITTANVQATGNGSQIFWQVDTGQGFKLNTDVAYVTVFNVTQNRVIGASDPAQTRGIGSITFSGDTGAIGDVVYVYLAFRRADGTIVSDSTYLDTVIA